MRDGVHCTESLLGPVDILVNSAGILYYTLMKNLHFEQWQQMVDVNIKGVLTCVGAVLGRMVERRQGHIVNISSDGGRKVGINAFCIRSNVIVNNYINVNCKWDPIARHFKKILYVHMYFNLYFIL